MAAARNDAAAAAPPLLRLCVRSGGEQQQAHGPDALLKELRAGLVRLLARPHSVGRRIELLVSAAGSVRVLVLACPGEAKTRPRLRFTLNSGKDWGLCLTTPLELFDGGGSKVGQQECGHELLPIHRLAAQASLLLAAALLRFLQQQQQLLPGPVGARLKDIAECMFWSRLLWPLIDVGRPSAQSLRALAAELGPPLLWPLLLGAPPCGQHAAVVVRKPFSVDVCALVALLHSLQLLPVHTAGAAPPSEAAVLRALQSLLAMAQPQAQQQAQRQAQQQQQHQQSAAEQWLALGLQGVALEDVVAAAADPGIEHHTGSCVLCGEDGEDGGALLDCSGCAHSFHPHCVVAEPLFAVDSALLSGHGGRAPLCLGCQGWPLAPAYWRFAETGELVVEPLAGPPQQQQQQQQQQRQQQQQQRQQQQQQQERHTPPFAHTPALAAGGGHTAAPADGSRRPAHARRRDSSESRGRGGSTGGSGGGAAAAAAVGGRMDEDSSSDSSSSSSSSDDDSADPDFVADADAAPGAAAPVRAPRHERPARGRAPVLTPPAGRATPGAQAAAAAAHGARHSRTAPAKPRASALPVKLKPGRPVRPAPAACSPPGTGEQAPAAAAAAAATTPAHASHASLSASMGTLQAAETLLNFFCPPADAQLAAAPAAAAAEAEPPADAPREPAAATPKASSGSRGVKRSRAASQPQARELLLPTQPLHAVLPDEPGGKEQPAAAPEAGGRARALAAPAAAAEADEAGAAAAAGAGSGSEAASPTLPAQGSQSSSSDEDASSAKRTRRAGPGPAAGGESPPASAMHRSLLLAQDELPVALPPQPVEQQEEGLQEQQQERRQQQQVADDEQLRVLRWRCIGQLSQQQAVQHATLDLLRHASASPAHRLAAKALLAVFAPLGAPHASADAAARAAISVVGGTLPPAPGEAPAAAAPGWDWQALAGAAPTVLAALVRVLLAAQAQPASNNASLVPPCIQAFCGTFFRGGGAAAAGSSATAPAGQPQRAQALEHMLSLAGTAVAQADGSGAGSSAGAAWQQSVAALLGTVAATLGSASASAKAVAACGHACELLPLVRSRLRDIDERLLGLELEDLMPALASGDAGRCASDLRALLAALGALEALLQGPAAPQPAAAAAQPQQQPQQDGGGMAAHLPEGLTQQLVKLLRSSELLKAAAAGRGPAAQAAPSAEVTEEWRRAASELLPQVSALLAAELPRLTAAAPGQAQAQAQAAAFVEQVATSMTALQCVLLLPGGVLDAALRQTRQAGQTVTVVQLGVATLATAAQAAAAGRWSDAELVLSWLAADCARWGGRGGQADGPAAE